MITDIDGIDTRILEEDDRIVAYLKGQMSAEEEQSFLNELKDNPELKQKAIMTARLVKGLKEVGSEQDRETQRVLLASSRHDVETATKNATADYRAACNYSKPAASSAYIAPSTATESARAEKPAVDSDSEVVSRPKAYKWFLIAASVICIVLLGITYNNHRNTMALGDKYDDIFGSSMIIRGGETNTEAEKKLQVLFINVKNNENIEGAIHDLSLCWELSTMETFNDYTNFSPEIGWNLAIAHLKNNDKKAAKAVLEKLISVSEEGSSVNDKAKELLEKLK